ncbi:BTAD domain-containing putative transcriptional regulator [Nocardioides sp. CFH 31398]|uniref:AfsR/SARP family transcriptional regulator n=1 Tax=Nocardioides sp. CFH 31398 TaxID=2919579 RepID=UPI001F069134|nr:BTAD domain-containing putative transcriptional regulator [Nocardioides sp. CFH 31398]MCH1865318.1 winged helix-turn-helix domain-containing protein [Nocardioides sp. CFH 31398]
MVAAAAAPSSPTLGVLGPTLLTVDGTDVELMPALRALLAALVVDAPRVVGVDTLLARVWDSPEEGSLATLHSYVSRLRRRLGPDVLLTRSPGYRLALAPDAVDAVRFTSLVRTAREEPDPSRARDLVAEALALWRGEAYADVPQQFARLEADRLAARHLEAHELAADLDLRLGRPEDVVERLAPLVAREPLHEGLRAVLMVALYRSGRQAAALEVYESGRHRLAEDLGVDPGPQLRRLHEQVLLQDPALDRPPAPSRPSPPSTPSRPPAAPTPSPTGATPPTSSPSPAEPVAPTGGGLVEPPTALVGRDCDLERVVAALRDDTRLLTLTGTGGVGKTRLALAVAGRLRQEVADGVVLVPLATVTDPALVLPTVVHALRQALPAPADGPAAAGDADPGDAAVALLRGRDVLLVLDNVEHLLDAAPRVSWLVGAAPGLRVLVTSRAPLRVNGEHEHLVEPLAVPRGGADVAEVASSPAVSLFMTRARAVSRGFVLDDLTVGPVAEICQRLAGIPLALELAASRVRVLTLQVLLQRLDEALSSGLRDLPARQRTMQATLDWSYRLLPEAAQRLFRDLAVFSGGWSYDLFADVVGADRIGDLEELVEHSLVTVSWSSDGRPRYGMLEPVAQHAQRLSRPDELASVTRAHARACVELAERAAVGYLGREQVTWLRVVDDEHANLLAAVERSLRAGDHTTPGRLAWSLWLYWWLRGLSDLGRRTAAAAAALPGAPPEVRTRATIALACMAYAQGDHTAAGEAWGRALEDAVVLGDTEAEANSRAGLGIAALARGDLAEARTRLEQALALTGTLPADSYGPWLEVLAQVWLGTALLETGHPDEARSRVTRAHALATARGDRLGAFSALWSLARLESGSDDAAARRHLREGIRLSQEMGDLSNLSYFLDLLVVIELRLVGDEASVERLATLLGAAESCRELGNGQAYGGYYLPDDDARDAAAATVRDRLGGASYDRCRRSGRVLGLDATVALALEGPEPSAPHDVR